MKFIVNLNGDVLCPYQVLLDISQQLPEECTGIYRLAFAPICDLSSTNDWINLESLGQPVALRAKEISDLIGHWLTKRQITDLSLDIYLRSGVLSSDNIYSLLCLAQHLNRLELTLITRAENLSSLKSGINSLRDQQNLCIHFNTQDAPSSLHSKSALFNQLMKARGDAIEQIGFQFSQPLSEAQINPLIGYAWVCLKSGAYDIACNLLQKATKQVGMNSDTQEQLFMHLLMMKFFSHQYQSITESDFPKTFTSLKEQEIKMLQFFKAYSATLSRNLAVAEEFFNQCHIQKDMPITDENSLYQLNLFALYHVLKEDTQTAFELEFRIKNHIEQHHIDIVGLKYVNLINLARLYKKIKDYPHALEYYHKAYNEICGGGYTTSDFIYYNINLGSLNEARGQDKDALFYWINAAIHWLSYPNKHALSWRPRLILCQETLNDIAKPLSTTKASLFLFNKIQTLLQRNLIPIQHTSQPAFSFANHPTTPNKTHCFIDKNIVFYTHQADLDAIPRKKSLEEQSLSTLVSNYLKTHLPIPENHNTLIIDTHLDTKRLHQHDEAIAFAKLSDCIACHFNGQWIDLEKKQWTQPTSASLSPIIESIESTENGLLLRYKRSFLNKTLRNQDEIQWVNHLKEATTINFSEIAAKDWHTMNTLAQKRVLNFDVHEEKRP